MSLVKPFDAVLTPPYYTDRRVRILQELSHVLLKSDEVAI